MNDDEYGVQLLRPLDIEPSGPPRIDVSRAMRVGARKRRRRWAYGGGFFAALTAGLVTGGLLLAPGQQHTPPLPVLPPDPPLPTACTLAQLDLGGHRSAQMTAGDHTGRWHIGIADPAPNKVNSLLVWHDGKLVDEVPPPTKTSREFAMYDMNASGVAVGTANSGGEPAYAYRDGKVIRLKGGKGAQANAINDDGVIAGTIKVGGIDTPARWRSIDAEPERLPMPPGREVRIWGISQDGTILGETAEGAYLWFPDGSAKPIPQPPAPGKDPTFFMPNGFSFGWIYGAFRGYGQSPEGLYRYDPASGTWQQVAKTTMQAQLDPGGRTGVLSMMQDDPAIFVGRQVLKLPSDPKLGDAGLGATEINAVSDDAHVVGGTALSGIADTSRPYQPLIWHCR